MARQGLMDDNGYHGFDDAETMAEKYCCVCRNQPYEKKNGELYEIQCDKDCTLADPKYFDECFGDCLRCGNKECEWWD